MMSDIAPTEDQPRMLEDALIVVRTQSQLMNRFLDQQVRLLRQCIHEPMLTSHIEQVDGRFEVRVSLLCRNENPS